MAICPYTKDCTHLQKVIDDDAKLTKVDRAELVKEGVTKSAHDMLIESLCNNEDHEKCPYFISQSSPEPWK